MKNWENAPEMPLSTENQSEVCTAPVLGKEEGGRVFSTRTIHAQKRDSPQSPPVLFCDGNSGGIPDLAFPSVNHLCQTPPDLSQAGTDNPRTPSTSCISRASQHKPPATATTRTIDSSPVYSPFTGHNDQTRRVLPPIEIRGSAHNQLSAPRHSGSDSAVLSRNSERRFSTNRHPSGNSEYE